MAKCLEKLSELVHVLWMRWSKSLARTEKLSPSRLKRWEKCWVPYDALSEEMKELDRKAARKIIRLVKSYDKD